ncbi:endonuclease/exonuclease/phosphatase family protein [Winogradskya humida]|uniref:Endonuclease n=1 Tax=Winogradskya humida TaxID=113566 RepID=A0ABQ4A4S5_9ACTN|nr:endonuclease/exonuclease/phosphatase family protein [Actinoplanes humidus]GIE25851.1 endonuclease [Actinoplanes humidus]
MPLPRVRLRRGRAVVALVALAVLISGDRAPARRAPVQTPAPRLATALDALAGPASAGDLDVMTFNLRYASSATPNSWAQRRPVVRTVLTTEKPDLIGTQEGLAHQLRDVAADLGDTYRYIGTGREGGNRGEHMAIFYDATRLAPLETGNFWLSGSPRTPGSVGWDARQPRMATWVLFADSTTGRRFYAVNTHLDNRGTEARRHGAELIRQTLAAFGPLPIVLTGDFNSAAEPGSPAYAILASPTAYDDTWTTAPRRGPAYATIHNYQPLIPGGERDDWILCTPGTTVLATLMNTYRDAFQYPSDHLPVEARLRLP